ncbi:hypothetical protein [Roseococcus microcysteis]|uniref:hypothetical protein n=1 Tax=Roseococcus microcysteis TaxID=2771361 RepID=UPI00168AE263|nr:hypothetical protein [Roseococcus microcysteis]
MEPLTLLALLGLGGGALLILMRRTRDAPPRTTRRPAAAPPANRAPAPAATPPTPPAAPAAPLTGPGTGPKFGLHYRDANGEETNRLFTLHEVQARMVDGAPWPYAIRGWCHLRKEERTFAVSRIISLFEVSTGDQLTEPAAIRGLLRLLSGPGHATAQDRRFEGARALDRADENAIDLAEDEQPRVRLRWRTAGGKGQERTTHALVLAYMHMDRGAAGILARPLRGNGEETWYFLDPQGTGVRHLLGIETDSGEALEGKALAEWVEALHVRTGEP